MGGNDSTVVVVLYSSSGGPARFASCPFGWRFSFSPFDFSRPVVSPKDHSYRPGPRAVLKTGLAGTHAAWRSACGSCPLALPLHVLVMPVREKDICVYRGCMDLPKKEGPQPDRQLRERAREGGGSAGSFPQDNDDDEPLQICPFSE